MSLRRRERSKVTITRPKIHQRFHTRMAAWNSTHVNWLNTLAWFLGTLTLTHVKNRVVLTRTLSLWHANICLLVHTYAYWRPKIFCVILAVVRSGYVWNKDVHTHLSNSMLGGFMGCIVMQGLIWLLALNVPEFLCLGQETDSLWTLTCYQLCMQLILYLSNLKTECKHLFVV